MEAKDILTKVKLLFNDLMAPAAAASAPAAPAPNEYELKDGGKVMIDKMEVGGIVMIDGAPALAGDLELADGTKITVADNGVIGAITPASAPDAPAAPEDMATKFTAFETSTNEKFTAYEAKFSSYEQRFAANEQKFAEYEAKLGKATEMIEQLLQFGKLMVEKPAVAADPAATVKNAFKEELTYSPALFSKEK